MPNIDPGDFALQDIPMCQKYKKRTCCLLTAGSFYTETEIPVGGRMFRFVAVLQCVIFFYRGKKGVDVFPGGNGRDIAA